MSRATTGEVSPAEQGVFVVHLSRARKHLQEERYDVARQELDLAALARPTDEDVLNLLSVIEFKRGYYNEAARACRLLLKNNPASAVLHSNLGLILFKAGVLVEAEQELRRALELQPDHVRSHLYLGLLYRLRGKLGLALEHLRYAGAKRVVVEIEEALRRNARDPVSRAAARATAASPPLKLAERVTPPPPRSAPMAVGVPAASAPEASPTVADLWREAGPTPDVAPAPEILSGGGEAAPPPEPSPETTDRIRVPDFMLPPFPEAELQDEADFLPEDVIPADAAPDHEAVRPPAIEDEETAPRPAETADARPRVSTRELSGPLSRESRIAAGAAAPEADSKDDLARLEPVPSVLPGDPDGGAPSRDEIEARPLFHVRPEGGLEIASRGVVYVRKGSVVWYSGKMRFSSEPSFRGTRLEKILRADGRGYLFVNDPGRQAYRRDMNGHALYIEGSRVLALDHGLSFRLEPIHDFRMNRRVDILKIFGRGSVILSVGGPLLSHEVTPEFPLNVSSRDLVAWTGELVPSVLEDRFLEEVMMPDIGSAPKIRFEGQGTVMTEPPRPRRRASDLARAPEADRRS
ncbi:MAG: AIM24 family protein [Thermoanaerobaculia bacterium]